MYGLSVEENRSLIEEMTRAYLEVEKRGRLEREIDRRVYDLYGLTEEEVRVVEGG